MRLQIRNFFLAGSLLSPMVLQVFDYLKYSDGSAVLFDIKDAGSHVT